MELLERLATLSHEQWSGWTSYIFEKGKDNEDGSFTIDAAFVARWKRQIATHYDLLSEDEKNSDRIEAQKVFDLVYGVQR